MEAGNRSRVVVAAGQFDPHFGDREHNLSKMTEMAQGAAENGARLIVFPEAALTGYGYESLEEALGDGESIPGQSTEQMAELASALNLYIAFGMVERVGNEVFNTVPLIGPEGLVGKYRKAHLPYEVLDRFATPGDLEFPVFDTDIGRIGIVICFDLRFPEPIRIYALKGADIILHPTNLPPPGAPQPDFMYQTRAAENRVWLVSADRVGTERGKTFIGRSGVISPNGEWLCEADGESEIVVTAEIEPEFARQKDIIVDPGVYELHTFGVRRPELYGALVGSR